MKQQIIRNFHLIKRVFTLNGNFVKGHELKNNLSKFLFQIFLRAKTLIKLCYVNIGLPVTGGDLLYFSANKSSRDAGNSVEKGSEQEKKCIGEYAVRHSVFV